MEQNTTTPAGFDTSDIRHGSFLLAREFPFLGADTDNGRVRFRFGCSAADAAAYFQADDLVSARKLFAAWHSLRTIIDDYRTGRSSNTNRRPPREFAPR